MHSRNYLFEYLISFVYICQNIKEIIPRDCFSFNGVSWDQLILKRRQTFQESQLFILISETIKSRYQTLFRKNCTLPLFISHLILQLNLLLTKKLLSRYVNKSRY